MFHIIFVPVINVKKRNTKGGQVAHLTDTICVRSQVS